MYNPKRGDQVMVSPHVSGPAAGRPGCASGNRRDGHYEILDRHPDRHDPQLLGWFTEDDLLPLVTGSKYQLIATVPTPEMYLNLSGQALDMVRTFHAERKLGQMVEAAAVVWFHLLLGLDAAGAPIDAAVDEFDRLVTAWTGGEADDGTTAEHEP